MTIEEQLSSLQKQIAVAQGKNARAEVERENAEKALNEALTALQTEFNVATIEEADALASKMETALQAALAKASEALEASNA